MNRDKIVRTLETRAGYLIGNLPVLLKLSLRHFAAVKQILNQLLRIGVGLETLRKLVKFLLKHLRIA